MEKEKQNNIEVIQGSKKDLNISPVYDHIKINKKHNKKDPNKKIIIPSPQKTDKNN